MKILHFIFFSFFIFSGCVTQQKNVSRIRFEDRISEISDLNDYRVERLLVVYKDLTIYHQMTELGLQNLVESVLLYGDDEDLTHVYELMNQYIRFIRPLSGKISFAGGHFPSYPFPWPLMDEDEQ